jgi:hypothetical protein
MRHAGQNNNNRRHRHRHNNNQRRGGGNNGAPNRMQVFDSNGPEVRIRGTAYQICEKYQALAKDAAAQGDTVMAESYLQHAEHYQRIINSWGLEQRPPQQMSSDQPQPSMDGEAGNRADQDEDELGLPASILGGNPQAAATDNGATVSRPSYAPQNEESLERA